MSDKRSVFTDALETLGTIIDDTQKRDAIHLAVEPMVAKEELKPGEHVTADGEAEYQKGSDGDVWRLKTVGIVDPFLKEPVEQGQRFWLVLYPRTIKSLRHVWEHPAFPSFNPEESREQSKKWMEDYAEKINEAVLKNREMYPRGEGDPSPITYEKIMNAGRNFIENDEGFGTGYDFFNEDLPDEFWPHYEVITGTKVDNHEDFLVCCA